MNHFHLLLLSLVLWRKCECVTFLFWLWVGQYLSMRMHLFWSECAHAHRYMYIYVEMYATRVIHTHRQHECKTSQTTHIIKNIYNKIPQKKRWKMFYEKREMKWNAKKMLHHQHWIYSTQLMISQQLWELNLHRLIFIRSYMYSIGDVGNE